MIVTKRHTQAVVSWEDLWAKLAARAMGRRAGKKPRPAYLRKWPQFRLNHAGKWLTYREMGKLAGATHAAAAVHVRSSPGYYERRVQNGAALVRVKEAS